MGLAFRFLLEQSGYDVIGNDLPGKGAEVEGDLSNIRERGRVVREVIHKSNGKLDGMIANAQKSIFNCQPELVEGYSELKPGFDRLNLA